MVAIKIAIVFGQKADSYESAFSCVHASYMANFDEIRKSSRAIFHEKADSYESAKNYMHRTSVAKLIITISWGL